MNKKQLKKYLEDPAQLSSSDTRKLSLLVDDYPYFQTARLLYAKGLQINDEEKFQQNLQTFSLYAVNRSKLYDLVTPIEQNIEVNQPTIEQTVTKTENTQELQKEEVAETTEQIEEIVETTEEETPIVEKTPTEEIPAEETVQAETTEQVEEIVETTEEETPIVEETITEEIPAEETVQEQITEQIEKIVETTEEETPIVEETITEEIPTEEIVQTETTEQVDEIVETTEEEIPIVEETTTEEIPAEETVQEQITEQVEERVETTENQTESLADQILRKYREMKAKEEDVEASTNTQETDSTPTIQEEIQQAENSIEENNTEILVEEPIFEETSTNEDIKEETIDNDQQKIEEHIEQEEPDGIETVTSFEDSTDDSPLSFAVTDFSSDNIVSNETEEIQTSESTTEPTIEFTENPISFEIEETEEEPQPTTEANPETQEEITFGIQDEEPIVTEEPQEQETHNWYETSQRDDTSHTQDIINTFIQSNYRTPLKTEVDTDEEEGMDKEAQEKYLKAGEAEVEFVTEAMAKVYEKQKLFGKAIKIYEKLSLKYPQKSVYFANRIKEIKH